jgi:SAM-dependent methyltransferase
MYEASPGRPSSERLKRDCAQYLASHFFPNVPPGEVHDGYRCENLEALTLADASFDVVITQDVMEHVLDPTAAFREVARILAPGGHHIFTTPVCMTRPTSVVRARRAADGSIEYLTPPEYHGNPIDPKGSLVTIQYGADITRLVEEASGLPTTMYRPENPHHGIVGEFLEVMVSKKPMREPLG